jgi:hypothetical protein
LYKIGIWNFCFGILFFYLYQMSSENLKSDVIHFFEEIQKYYGSKTEIMQGLFAEIDNLDANQTTWNLSEFELVRSAYRNSGGKFMLEGNGTYYEISAEKIISFIQNGRNKFEFIEQYNETFFRITKIRFHYKY